MLSSSIPETDYAAWNGATAYSLGARVIRTSTHRIYERLIAGTSATAPESDPTNWLEIGATNRWKMFDTISSTQTENTGSIVVTITPGQVINSLALLNVSATSVRVKMTDPVDGVVYDKTLDLQAPPSAADFWTYVFEPISQKTIITALDLPSYGSAAIEVTISATGNVACGVFIIGVKREIGLGVQYGARVGIQDYSRKERDTFGNTILVQRAYSKKASIDMLVGANEVDYLQSLLASIRTTPTLWVGSEKYESLAIYGFYKDFSTTIAYHDYSHCQLEIEGLI